MSIATYDALGLSGSGESAEMSVWHACVVLCWRGCCDECCCEECCCCG